MSEHLTLKDWTKWIQDQGWELHLTMPERRGYTHSLFDVMLMVGLDKENIIQCEVTACLPTTFIQVTSNKFAVNKIQRYDYVILLARRITHACRAYSHGAP